MTNYTTDAVAALVQEWRERAARLETTWTASIGPAAIDFVLEDGGVTCAYVRPDADSDETIAGITESYGHSGEDPDAVLVAGITTWLTTPGDDPEASR